MLEKYLKGEILFNIENIINDISNWQDDYDTTKEIENLTDTDIKIICSQMLSDNGFMENLNGFINENIENEIYHYIYYKRGE